MRNLLAILLLLGVLPAQAAEFDDCDAMTGAPASGDLLVIKDIDGGVVAPCGTARKITASNLLLLRFPASSTDNACARFDGTGATLQNSTGCTIDDSGNITATSFVGPVTGSVTGNAGTVTAMDAGGDTTTFPCLATSATGSLPCSTDPGLSYDATTNVLSVSGGVVGAIGGSTGASDNAILRADGTGGATLQSSVVRIQDAAGNSVTIDTDAGTAVVLKATAPTQTASAQAGKDNTIQASDAVAGSSNAGAAGGGSIKLQPGAAARLTSGNADAGHVEILAATGVGTGVAAQVLQYNHGTVARPAYAFDISGNRAYGWWYASGAMNWSHNGVRALAIDSGSVNGADGAYKLGEWVRIVQARTSNATESANEYFSFTTNEGTTARVDRTLPNAAGGGNLCYAVQDTDGLRVIASSGDTIRIADKVTASAGYIESLAVGSIWCGVAINATEWFTFQIKGTWTDGTFTYDDTGLTTP
jgi:hypothetical protein